MLEILFLPFLLFEGLFSGIAKSLNITPPPRPFSQLVLSQGRLPLLGPPQLQTFIQGAARATLSNEEVESIERDEQGFVIRRTIRRVVKED